MIDVNYALNPLLYAATERWIKIVTGVLFITQDKVFNYIHIKILKSWFYFSNTY